MRIIYRKNRLKCLGNELSPIQTSSIYSKTTTLGGVSNRGCEEKYNAYFIAFEVLKQNPTICVHFCFILVS